MNIFQIIIIPGFTGPPCGETHNRHTNRWDKLRIGRNSKLSLPYVLAKLALFSLLNHNCTIAKVLPAF